MTEETPRPRLLAIIEDLQMRVEALERGPGPMPHYVVHYLRTGSNVAACGTGYGRRVQPALTDDPVAVTCRACRRTAAWGLESGMRAPEGTVCRCSRHPYPATRCVTLGNVRDYPSANRPE